MQCQGPQCEQSSGTPGMAAREWLERGKDDSSSGQSVPDVVAASVAQLVDDAHVQSIVQTALTAAVPAMMAAMMATNQYMSGSAASMTSEPDSPTQLIPRPKPKAGSRASSASESPAAQVMPPPPAAQVITPPPPPPPSRSEPIRPERESFNQKRWRSGSAWAEGKRARAAAYHARKSSGIEQPTVVTPLPRCQVCGINQLGSRCIYYCCGKCCPGILQPETYHCPQEEHQP